MQPGFMFGGGRRDGLTGRRLAWALLVLPIVAGAVRAEEVPPDRVDPRGHAGDVEAVAFTPDGETLVTAGSDGLAKLWDVATEKVRADLTGHEGKVLCVAVSPDGKAIATGGQDRMVRLWSTAAGPAVRRVAGPSRALAAPDC